LVDGEIGPTPLDVLMLEWLADNAIAHTVVATKIDKIKSSQRQHRRRQLAAACHLEPGDVVWVSAAKNINLDILRGLVESHLTHAG
jgi:GTP-binding protein